MNTELLQKYATLVRRLLDARAAVDVMPNAAALLIAAAVGEVYDHDDVTAVVEKLKAMVDTPPAGPIDDTPMGSLEAAVIWSVLIGQCPRNEKLVTDYFVVLVIAMARECGCQPDDLMKAIDLEAWMKTQTTLGPCPHIH